MNLNDRSDALFEELFENPDLFRVACTEGDGWAIVDCGAKVPGGLDAGIHLAKMAMGDLAYVEIQPGPDGLLVQVHTDHPLAACLGSQYAGWQIAAGKYFAMGSGPMRAAYGKEAIYSEYPDLRDEAETAVGVLETRKEPAADALRLLREKLPKSVADIHLAFAPTASLAGTIQVVARSLETALHKLHVLKFDLKTIVSGHGVAPLPPIGTDDLQAIGRTNDAILYSGHVTLWVDAEDDALNEIGPRVPSNSSAEYGRPFSDILKAAGGDFYKIDPLLFAPAAVEFVNLKTGRRFAFGEVNCELARGY